MIYPTSDIRLYSGIPFDNTYAHVRLFANLQEQREYFSKQRYVALFDESYTKSTDNILRVNMNAEQLYNVNYVSFTNMNVSNKTFYGFVTKIEYKNPSTTWLHFEIDVWQTYWLNCEMKQSYIEREHVQSDVPGEHIVPEGLELGAYTTSTEQHHKIGELIIYLMVSEVDLGEQGSVENLFDYKPGTIGGYPNPCWIANIGKIDSYNVDKLKDILDKYSKAGKNDAIVCIYTSPSNFTLIDGVRNEILPVAPRLLTSGFNNNKLLTYPYTTLVVNTCGQSNELRYELFDDIPYISVYKAFGVNMEVVVVPHGYENIAENYLYTTTLSGFPLLPYTQNYYQNWLAQNKAQINVSKNSASISMAVGGVGGAVGGAKLGMGVGTAIAPGVGTAVGGAVGGIVGAGIGALGGMTQIASQNAMMTQQQIIPDQMVGQATAGDTLAVMGEMGIYTYCRTITPEYVSIIDDFFDKYGYKVNISKIPNLFSRPSWNYIKMIAPNLIGDIPTTEMYVIKNILNNGVTCWHTDDVLNYNLNNKLEGGE